MNWYWDWGIAVSAVVIWLLGFAYGAAWYKDRCEKRIHAENVRLATKNTIVTSKAPEWDKPVYLEDEWEKG